VERNNESKKRRFGLNKKFFAIVGSFVMAVALAQGGWCADPIKIGLIGALSAPYGASNKLSMEISTEELNKAGGIMGRPVKLIVEDWKREVPLAVAAYKKLVMSEKCLVVFTEGTEGTTACMQEATQLYSEFPHLQFAFWTAHDGPTDTVCAQYEKYKFFFRPYPKTGDSYDPQLKFYTLFSEVIGTKKLALVVEDIGWTQPYLNGIPGKYPPLKDFLEQKGIRVVYYAKSAIGEKMFLPTFEKIAASGADTTYWVTGYTDTITMAKQWAESAAKNIDLVAQSGACSYAAFWNMTGGASLGWVSTWPEVRIPFTEKSLPFLNELNKRGGGLTASTYGAYDGPWIIKAAVEKVGNTKDIEALIKALETVEVKRGFWTWKFDKCHDPVKGYPYHPLLNAQFQENGKYLMIFSEDIRKIANPNDKFIRVKELRAKVGQK
jgi:branched-chain amino acid transport system substrate-binding protein